MSTYQLTDLTHYLVAEPDDLAPLDKSWVSSFRLPSSYYRLLRLFLLFHHILLAIRSACCPVFYCTFLVSLILPTYPNHRSSYISLWKQYYVTCKLYYSYVHRTNFVIKSSIPSCFDRKVILMAMNAVWKYSARRHSYNASTLIRS